MEFSKIIWKDATPKSEVFGDFYFSSDAAIDESAYNFLDHNLLPDRFATILRDQKFYICETGFGSGLNFILAMNLWNFYAREGAVLEFISFEKYPLSRDDLRIVLHSITGLVGYENLLDIYSPIKGVNNYQFGNITLKLIVDDICNIKAYSLPKIDAWFFDGFAPTKNSSMWSNNLFNQISQFSGVGTTFATFTASSKVRKNLQNNGFVVKKDVGFGKKREMMFGFFKG